MKNEKCIVFPKSQYTNLNPVFICIRDECASNAWLPRVISTTTTKFLDY